LSTFMIIIALLLIQCGASNRLREYEFRNQTISATMASVHGPQVFTEEFIDVNHDNILESAIRLGTSIAKEVEAQKAQKRLNNAMQEVDIPEQIRIQTLNRCAEYLHFQSVDESRNADFMLMMTIQKYGIEAKSWNSSVYFKIDTKVKLIDNQKNILVWKKSINEREPISGEMFGLGGAAGNIITTVALSELSEEEMAAGFIHLADYIAERIAEKLHHDFIKARSK
jgi:hypothetical protein